MNPIDRRDALKTLINTTGWQLLLLLVEEDRQRLLSNMANTKPNAEGALDIAYAQGQISVMGNLDNFVAGCIRAFEQEIESPSEE